MDPRGVWAPTLQPRGEREHANASSEESNASSVGYEPVEEPANLGALLSEAALADWNRPEEDRAWSHLQSEP